MIQDIVPHKFDITYCTKKVQKQDRMLVYGKQGLLCREAEDGIAFPLAEEIEEMDSAILKEAVFLFRIDKEDYFGLPEAELCTFGAYRYMPKQKLRNVRPLWQAFAGITGFQIDQWYRQNRFCGQCGAKMKRHDTERAMQCTSCGRISYPQICPSVIVGILHDGKILLTKYAPSHSSFRKYALVAGYAEVGESLEDTVRREVMEEVGLRVKNIRYYKSQPWSFSNALLAGFFCEADGEAQITMDRGELSAAEWFEREALPDERSEASVSLTGEMIEAFRAGLAL